VLDDEGRKMRVRYMVRMDAGEGQERAEDLPMALRRLRRPSRLAGEPGAHLAPSLGQGRPTGAGPFS
jgi:hypothetical protein